MKSFKIFSAPFLTILCIVFVSLSNTVKAREKPTPPIPAEWTILIFMNADNSLSPQALPDFTEMANLGSNDKIKIVAQIDRSGPSSPDFMWGQTLRFEIKKGMRALPEYAMDSPGELNMGNGAVLRDFVDWGMINFPARKTMLIIWSHGRGYRFALDGSAPVTTNSSKFSAYKSSSNDETDQDELYNREIQDALSPLLRSNKLEIIGFDACLMGMVETAYAVRDLAKIMVASQELVPETGWQYDDWLKQLVAKPTMDGKELARILVKSYADVYQRGLYMMGVENTATISAIDLVVIDPLCLAIDQLAVAMIPAKGNDLAAITQARGQCKNYAPEDGIFYHIDLIRFCELIGQSSANGTIKSKATAVRQAFQNVYIDSRQGKERTSLKGYGSNGLCIYFPATKSEFDQDQVKNENGYLKSNHVFPVEFVQKFKWADFLKIYLK